MDPQSKYLLFYSNQSAPCRNFLVELYKNREIYNTFIKIDVTNNNRQIKIPKCVRAVPTIIIKTPGKKPVIYTGDVLFDWLKQLLKYTTRTSSSSVQKPGTKMGDGPQVSGGISEYDPCAMAGFSDNFSFIEGIDKPMEHQFEFVGSEPENGPPSANNRPMQQSLSPQPRPTQGGDGGGGRAPQYLPHQPSVSGNMMLKTEDVSGSNKKDELDNAFEQLQAQRSMEVPNAPVRQGGGNTI